MSELDRQIAEEVFEKGEVPDLSNKGAAEVAVEMAKYLSENLDVLREEGNSDLFVDYYQRYWWALPAFSQACRHLKRTLAPLDVVRNNLTKERREGWCKTVGGVGSLMAYGKIMQRIHSGESVDPLEYIKSII